MEAPATEVKQLGHLGVIAAIFKEYKIIEKFELLLQKTSNHKIFLLHPKASLHVKPIFLIIGILCFAFTDGVSGYLAVNNKLISWFDKKFGYIRVSQTIS